MYKTAEIESNKKNRYQILFDSYNVKKKEIKRMCNN